MFSYSPNSIKPTIQPRAAYTDFTPAGPWADGTVVIRNSDGVGFTYSAALNALSINPNLSASVKDANNFIIQNLPAPTNAADAVNKNYVDTHSGGGGITDAPSDGTTYGRNNAAWVNTPIPSSTTPVMDGTGAVGAATVYARGDHVHPTDTSRAPLASPTFTGTPAAPTAAVDTNTTQVATTAFVIAQASATGDGTPGMDGTAARGSAIHWARADHVHPTDTSRAPLASPVFTGNPTAPTPVVDDNDQSLATTAYVIGQASASGDGTPTMDGTASRGTSTHWARADHTHPSDTTKLSDAPSDGTTYGRKNGAWFATAGAGAVVIRSYFAGLTLSTAGSSTTFSIAAGVACDSTIADMLSLPSSINKTTGAWAVGTGNGALDTGTIANSTWYHAYVIKRVDTGVVDVLVSLSATAPTLPSPYTLFRRIGSMKTNASAQWTKFSQRGDEFLWDAPVAEASNVAVTNGAQTVTMASVPTGVQVNALFSGRADYVSAAVAIWFSSFDVAAVTPGGAVAMLTVASGGTGNASAFNIRTNTSAQIRMNGNGTGSNYNVVSYGWIDRRGKDL